MKVFTIFDDEARSSVLFADAAAIPLTKEGFEHAAETIKALRDTIEGMRPAAGLAAPQIGISERVFVFAWDRQNFEEAINPEIIEVGNANQTSYEACFSARKDSQVSQAALLTRADEITVQYYNLKGEIITKHMKGFAAKVFQHEFDHLNGIVNVRKDGAEVKEFSSGEEMVGFMTSVRNNDSKFYEAPTELHREIVVLD